VSQGASNRVVAVIQARMGSSRLPGKVMRPLGGVPVLARIVDAARRSRLCDEVVVATSSDPRDQTIMDWCAASGVVCYAGSEEDVLRRILEAAEEQNADIVVRLTADCPFMDPSVIDQTVWLLTSSGAEYASNTPPWTWPDGLDVEAFTVATLRQADMAADLPSEREHVTRWIRANRSRFAVRSLLCPLPDLAARRWTLDTEEDYTYLDRIASQFDPDSAPGFLEVADCENRLIAAGEIDIPDQLRNDIRGALQEDLAMRAEVPRRYNRSNAIVEKVDARVPLASQTFSKSRVVLPEGRAPLFLSHGLGCRTWDIDGNEYVDLVMSLLSVSLGHCDPDVDAAVRHQMTSGVSLSLASELEHELAALIGELVPSAEAVRYGKNGTDATSAAVRVSRAFTGRDGVIATGYHGWQDWYIGKTARNRGVPDQSHARTHLIASGDLNDIEGTLRASPGDVACIMVEPVYDDREAGAAYLGELRRLADRFGCLLVYDETITGFRISLGGAQEYYGVRPDLTTLGKGLANGYPLSCLAGRADVMSEAREVFLSATFGGETVSLAAALATLRKMCDEPVIEHIWRQGSALRDRVNAILTDTELQDVFELKGIDPWVIVSISGQGEFSPAEVKTFFLKEMMNLGVLMTASHNISYAHGDGDVALVGMAYERVLPELADLLRMGTLRKALDCKLVEPVFQVRRQ
jgi:glutamate-1-semialdehyde aminotransferase/spore coat polysaccharide biosynthesis protein SpsF (cytidylyltransferase family)